MAPSTEEPLEKPIRFSPHAEKKIELRELDRALIEKVLDAPDAIIPTRPPRMVFQKKFFDRILKQDMLFRVVVEETETYRVVVTAYRTSKLDKYMR